MYTGVHEINVNKEGRTNNSINGSKVEGWNIQGQYKPNKYINIDFLQIALLEAMLRYQNKPKEWGK